MEIAIRRGRIDDARSCGLICYEAFKTVAEAHNFPPDFPSPEASTGVIASLLASEGVYGVVAEIDGAIVGSNFLDERNSIGGVGPITVDPAAQNRSVGARLMAAVMDRAAGRALAGVRLVQAGYHCRSLALYAKLGFEVREHLSCLQGPAIAEARTGYQVRPATEDDLEACNRLCARVHGHHRGGELKDAIGCGGAVLVERDGRIAAYSTSIAFSGYAVAETNDDLQALIGAASALPGPGFLVPSRNGELLRWCLARGLQITQPMTLMTRGLYNEPAGAFLPSVLY